MLCIEASRTLPVKQVQGQGPLATFQGEQLSERIGLVPILRAGLGMTEACLDLLPENTSVLHIGLFREKVSLQPVEYYNKLPISPTVDQVLIVDPLIATGGTAAVSSFLSLLFSLLRSGSSDFPLLICVVVVLWIVGVYPDDPRLGCSGGEDQVLVRAGVAEGLGARNAVGAGARDLGGSGRSRAERQGLDPTRLGRYRRPPVRHPGIRQHASSAVF